MHVPNLLETSILRDSHFGELFDPILSRRKLDFCYGRTKQKVDNQHQIHKHIQAILGHPGVGIGPLLVERFPAAGAEEGPVLQKAERVKSFRKDSPVISGGACGLGEEGSNESARLRANGSG